MTIGPDGKPHVREFGNVKCLVVVEVLKTLDNM